MRQKNFKIRPFKFCKTKLLAIIAMLIIGAANAQIDGIRVTTPNDIDTKIKGKINYPLQQVSVQKECEKAVYAQIAGEIANNSNSIEEKKAWSQAAFGGDLTDDYGRTYKYPLPTGNFRGIHYIERYNNLCIEVGCRTDLRTPQNNVTYPNRTPSTSGTNPITTAATTSIPSLGPIDTKTALTVAGVTVGVIAVVGITKFLINSAEEARIAREQEFERQRELNTKMEEEKIIKQQEFKVDATNTLSTFKGGNIENKSNNSKNNPLGLRTVAKLSTDKDNSSIKATEDIKECKDCTEKQQEKNIRSVTIY